MYTTVTQIINNDDSNYERDDPNGNGRDGIVVSSSSSLPKQSVYKDNGRVMMEPSTDIEGNDNNNLNELEEEYNDDDDDDGEEEDDDSRNEINPTSDRRSSRRRSGNNKNRRYRTLYNTARYRKSNNSNIPKYRYMMMIILLCIAIIILLIYLRIIIKRNHQLLHTKSTTTINTSSGSGALTSSTSSSTTITYDPSISQVEWNPFHIHDGQNYYTDNSASIISPTLYSLLENTDIQNNDNNNSNNNTSQHYGYMMQPNIVQNHIVFVSQGDLYYTTLPNITATTVSKKMTTTTIPQMTAIRLTYTIGNVRDPKINPIYPYLIAYTATYQARRELYIYDLRRLSKTSGGNVPVQRLTYVDSIVGIYNLIGWSKNGTVLTYGTTSIQIGLRDLRLYDIAIVQQQHPTASVSTSMQILETRPVPLSQAVDGVRLSKIYSDTAATLEDNNNDDEECIIFVRYKQSSHTARYVGGATEQLWLYCNNETQAIPLTNDYIGTSKQPTIYYYTNHDDHHSPQRYLLFLGDRTPMSDPIGPKVFQSPNQHWRATTMNLWAVPLPNHIIDLYQIYQQQTSTTTNPNMITIFPPETMIQITHISCQFNGLSLQEYTVDTTILSSTQSRKSTGVILRIGADLYHLSSDQIEAKILTSDVPPHGTNDVPALLPIQVLSDYHEQQERMILMNFPDRYGRIDVFTTHYDSLSLLMTLRGQVWVAPVLDISNNDVVPYQGSAGMNTPPRRYRVIPGSMTGGAIRVLAALNVPLYTNAATTNTTNENPNRRLALVLATDPMSPTAEHAFYMVEIQADLMNQFNDLNHWPLPFVGGHVNGGSTKDGGLGTVREGSVQISSCGRRFAWTDTDNRICVMTMPIYNNMKGSALLFRCLPSKNDQGEPLSGTLSSLKWSPGGRYLGIEHSALNQFSVISIADCGSPENEKGDVVVDIEIGRITQVTPARFNSYAFCWGKSSFDVFWSSFITLLGYPAPKDVSTTLYFVSDRDVISDVTSPWGSRAPQPHFTRNDGHVYALPLPIKATTNSSEFLDSRYPGGGTAELFYNDLNALLSNAQSATNKSSRSRQLHESIVRNLSKALKGRQLRGNEKITVTRYLQDQSMSDGNGTIVAPTSPFPQDGDLDLPYASSDVSFAQVAYRIPRIPKGNYASTSQTLDDGSFILMEHDEIKNFRLKFYSANAFPSDVLDGYTVADVYNSEESTSGKHYIVIASTGETIVIPKTGSGLLGFVRDEEWVQNRVDNDKLAISVWPNLEYRHMYSDAWRLMRDYFYDMNMHNINWADVHTKYLPLVQRCGKREELDDVLGQMASETSALHSFVYGGEYNSPDTPPLEPASLGSFLQRTPEWKGYMVQEIPEPDPDFQLVNGNAVYCPISELALRPTGQRGLAVGDVIVAVNGESVLTVPDINMLLRGTDGRSIRLEVLRLSSGSNATPGVTVANTESLIVVPISTYRADALRYNAWEWKTRELAKSLAKDSGFTVGYVHMQAMNRDGEDAFARGYYPDYDKDALILDVRHNMGGNIDSWILTTLQRKAFMYWGPRSGDARNGEFDWDEQFAFRGKVIVLVDELTASNGEGVARGISELGIGKVIGTRTWGGGIWGSSSNHLVDGGLAAAPQWGIFNTKFGWGGGIEMTGVQPDIVIDNDPYLSFHGRDMQLERAIAELSTWIKNDPIPAYETPAGGRPDMSLHDDCSA